jgi:drug/metabolite transporter (DMT)-like permease
MEPVSRRALLCFIGLGIAWGIPYLLIKVAVRELSPEQVVLGRTVVAAVIMLPVALARGTVRPVLAKWKWLLAFTLVEIAVPWVALGTAEQKLPSSTTGLLIAAVPIVGVVLAFLTGRPEPLDRLNWLGLALGIAGVAALVGLDVGGSQGAPLAELALVVVCYAVGPLILARRLADVPGIGVSASAITLTAIAYLPIVLVHGGVPSTLPSAEVVSSLLLLGVVCTAIAFVLLFALVAEIGPVRSTTITYVNPAVAVVAGAVVLGEAITLWAVLGFALVVSGSYFVNRRRRDVPADAAAGAALQAPRPADARR